MNIAPINYVNKQQYPSFGARSNFLQNFVNTLNTPVEGLFVKRNYTTKELKKLWQQELGLPKKASKQTIFQKLSSYIKSFAK